MIQSKNKDYTIVVHDAPSPPRFFKINKRLLKFTLILILGFSFLSISMAFLYTTYIQNKVERSKNSVPQEILDLKKELKDTNLKLQAEIKLTKNLQFKLTDTGSDFSNLHSLVPLPLGFKDLRENKNASIENISANSQQNKTILKFDIFNNTKDDTKLSGYVYVFKYTAGKIEAYPTQEIDEYKLTNGERFTITKFRPTRISFEKTDTESLYKIFVFSRTGDLLDYQQYKK